MILGIPGVNGLGNTKGTEKTPKLFLDSSKILTLNSSNLEEQQNFIYNFVSGLKREKLFFIGGDHSISYPIGKSFFRKYSNGKLLVFDAHPDLMESMKEPTHEEWLRGLIEKEKIKCKNILIVGVRRNSKNAYYKELEYAEKNHIKIIFSDEFNERKNEILDFISSGDLYVSFDIDVFDENLMSATGYPEPDGLNENQIFEILSNISKENLKFFDLVEYNSLLDNDKKGFNLVQKVLKNVMKVDDYEK